MKENAHYIQIGEHKFELPPVPPKKEIFFSDLPKAEQYWRRTHTVYPSFFYEWYHPYSPKGSNKVFEVETRSERTVREGKRLISLNKEDSDTLEALIKEERRRMIHGVWFMNNGEPTYITGNHYGVLQWLPFKGSVNEVDHSIYGMYMRLQRDFCYFLEIIKTTPLARGGNVVKPKKTGITQLMACCILVDAMLHKTSLYRIMSIKEETAIKSCMSYMKYALKRMPAILTPYIGKENMSEITFGEPDGTKGNRNKPTENEIDFLETTITTVPTAAQSFDSLTNTIAWIDEESKITEASPKDIHNVTTATVMIGSKRHGYIIYTHYVAEKNNKSFMEARTIYMESKLRTIVDGMSQTKSKLLCFPLNVWDGIQGCIDKYGAPVRADIVKFLADEIAACEGDDAKMQAHIRQYPHDEADCWKLGAGEKSVFDNIRLGFKLSQLTDDAAVGVYPYFEFNFKWTKAPTIDEQAQIYEFPGKVYIERTTDEEKRQNKHGAFRFYREEYFPQGFIDKWSNNLGKHRNGKLCPLADNPYYAAMDPAGMSGKKEVVTASNTAMQVFMLPNPEIDGIMGKVVTNQRPFITYRNRPDNPMDTLKHCIQLIMFCGCYILVECNQMWVYNRLIKYGFENFLIVLDENGVLVPYKASDPKQKPFTSQTTTIGYYVAAGQMHYGQPEVSMDTDNIDNLEDEHTIEDLILFDPNDTTKFDSGVCNLIGKLGIAAYLGWRQNQKKKNNPEMQAAMAQVLRYAIQ